jgi:hypothetical protein
MASAHRPRVAEPEVEAVPEPPIEDPVEFTPKTELGRILKEARKGIIASGQPLLDWDELEQEIASRRTSYFRRASMAPTRHLPIAEPEVDQAISEDEAVDTARTQLWRDLMRIREQAIASGMRLFDWDDIEREVAERRGGLHQVDE